MLISVVASFERVLKSGKSAVLATVLILFTLTVQAGEWGLFDGMPREVESPSNSGIAESSIDSWQPGQLISPEQLSSTFSNPSAEKPVILCVAPNVLFRAGHIPGAKRIGPTSQPESMEILRSQTQSIVRNKEIVLYCGCCPWQHCPNVQPAFAELQKMGFTKVRVLHILNNFKQDWTDKGYPVIRGE